MNAPRQVLVLGAGQSTPVLISDLLDHAQTSDWEVVVADRDEALAKQRVGDHPRGRALGIDARDRAVLRGLVAGSKVVVNFLAPVFQFPVAELCVELGAHMISASYLDLKMSHLDAEVRAKGLTFLGEMGLDPGIDHMSAMELIHRIRNDGGRVVSFASYGSGVPAPEDRGNNPLGYAITWNPRNIAMNGEAGAAYLENGSVQIAPFPDLFRRLWTLEVPGVGMMEAYPNRNSIGYQATYGLEHAHTLIRGTLRYPGFSETWYHIARLGLPNERLMIPRLAERTFGELTAMCVPAGPDPIEARVARRLGVSPDSKVIEDLRWLGLFGDQQIGALGDPAGSTPAGALTLLLADRLRLGATDKDMVVLMHDIETEWPDRPDPNQRFRSTLVYRGKAGGPTAMSTSVGLPAAIVARLLMVDSLPGAGVLIPTEEAIYRPVLEALANYGLKFEESP